MIKLLFTTDQLWLEKWDAFVIANSRGSHLVLSDWLMSYRAYGFDYELGIAVQDNKIIGGFGAVIPKSLVFKFYILPHAPVYTRGYEHYFNEHMQQIIQRAKQINSCYLQISVPISSDQTIDELTYQPQQVDFLKEIFNEGKLFNHIYSSYGLNWLDLEKIDDENLLLPSLKNHAKRNIKIAYKSNLSICEANSNEEIKEAYNLVEQNARDLGYAVRTYNEIQLTLNNLIKKKYGVFLIAKKSGQLKGSAFYIKNDSFLTYIFGGTIREKPDLKVGYFLHWEAIKMAIVNRHHGYNISMGGTKGVLRFKSQFNAEQLFYDTPNYNLVLKRKRFYLYRFIIKKIKPHKKLFSNILAKFQGR